MELFEFYNYEIVNKDLYLYSKLDIRTLKKFSRYDLDQLANIVDEELMNIETGYRSWDLINNYDSKIKIIFPTNSLGLSMLYDHVKFEEIQIDIESDHIQNKREFLNNYNIDIYSEESLYIIDSKIYIKVVKNGDDINYYINSYGTGNLPLEVKDAQTFLKVLIIHFSYYHIKFEIIEI